MCVTPLRKSLALLRKARGYMSNLHSTFKQHRVEHRVPVIGDYKLDSKVRGNSTGLHAIYFVYCRNIHYKCLGPSFVRE